MSLERAKSDEVKMSTIIKFDSVSMLHLFTRKCILSSYNIQSFRIGQAQVHTLKFAEGYVKDNNKEEGAINDKETAVAFLVFFDNNENKVNIYSVNKVDLYSVDYFFKHLGLDIAEPSKGSNNI